jgi:hypothetical protein
MRAGSCEIRRFLVLHCGQESINRELLQKPIVQKALDRAVPAAKISRMFMSLRPLTFRFAGFLAFALPLAVAGVMADAGAYDGLFRPAPTTDCSIVGGDGGALKIEDDVFFGVESQCRMTRATNVRDMDATLYDMDCTGEGEDWTQRALFMRAADDGLILVWNGFAFKYDRCPVNPVRGTVTTAEDLGIAD